MLAIGLAVVVAGSLTGASAHAAPSGRPAAVPNLGANVTVFDPSMPVGQIQATLDAVAAKQVDNEMGADRYAFLFKPGTYGTDTHPLQIKVGYYTEISGLGASPGDVVINGKIEVYNRCLADNGASNCLALVNFWRTLSNLSIHVNAAGQDGCRSTANFWAVSQASSLRRIQVTGGNLSLMDYCTAGPQYASGGFIADSALPTVVNGSQQQWITRNSSVTSWSNGVWNQVFVGDPGAPPQSFSATSGLPNGTPPYTTLASSPVTQEEPFLTTGPGGSFRVFVPALRHSSVGPSWSASSPGPGTSLPLSQFFIASPGTKVAAINLALLAGKNLILGPGVYHLSQTILVSRPHTIVLGLGFPTLVPEHGITAMNVAATAGTKLSGMIFDAGPAQSRVLLQVGDAPIGSPAQPTLVQDVFFRIGGATAGKAATSLVVNSSDVILDDIWAWRADHGTGVGWTVNTAQHGVVVNGNNVLATGLFVEHYQNYDVQWLGNGGETIFFQNEMPYDPPNQAAWMNGSSNGYAAYEVGPSVTSHQAYGLGSYCFFNVNPAVVADRAFEAPNTPGVQFHDILTVSLGGVGVINHVINTTGGATPSNTTPVDVTSYP